MNREIINKIYKRYCQEYGPLMFEGEEEELYKFAVMLATDNIGDLFKINEKYLRIYKKYLGIYHNGLVYDIDSIAKEEKMAVATVKKIIKKVKELERKKIYEILVLIYADNFEFEKINIIDGLDLSEEQWFILYKLDIRSVIDIISLSKEEFRNKVISFDLWSFVKKDINMNFRRNLFDSVCNSLNKIGLSFIDELEDGCWLKEYLNVYNQINLFEKEILKLKSCLSEFYDIRNSLKEFLNSYEDIVLGSFFQENFWDLSKVSEEEYKIILKEKIKHFDDLIEKFYKLLLIKNLIKIEKLEKKEIIVRNVRIKNNYKNKGK